MTAARNAAIWFVADAYDPSARGMNGRRVAGQSFLDGFLTHADVERFIGICPGGVGEEKFRAIAGLRAPGRQVDVYPADRHSDDDNISTVFFPAPTIASQAWRRFNWHQTAFSICGITHTISTLNVMQQIFDMRMAPVEPWDAVICTSRAVQSSVTWQLDQVDAYIERRFGYAPPPRPQLPVIPLGVNQDAIAAPEAEGAALRQSLGIAPDTRVAMVMSRLSVNEKFDPLPVYQALQIAQSGFSGQIALILCGFFNGTFDEQVFRDGAARLMPDVPLHVVDGKNPASKAAAFAASDFFLFCIDNLQETFGLAPIEAMAAKLPVVVSDWDGLKDTVTPDVGFRIRTTMAEGLDRGRTDILRHVTGQDSYHRFLSNMATRTVIDVPQMADKILLLARDHDLARRMGEAARQRVSRHYDWSAIIPQYQDLWAQLSHTRHLANQDQRDRYRGLAHPLNPPAVDMFSSYPSQVGLPATTRVSARHTDGKETEKAIEALARLRQSPISARALDAVKTIWRYCETSDHDPQLSEIVSKLNIRPVAAEQLTTWLLKYDFLRKV